MIFAIGDLHGNYDALRFLLEHHKIAKFNRKQRCWGWIRKKCTVVCTGDFIDSFGRNIHMPITTRQAQNREKKIIECFRQLQADRRSKMVVLLGNHEFVAVTDYLYYLEYGVRDQKADADKRGAFIRREVLPFVRKLPVIYREDGYVFSHGGFEIAWLRKLQDARDLTRPGAWQDRAFQNLLNEGTSVLFSRTMSLRTSDWLRRQRDRVRKYFGPREVRFFVQGHTPVDRIHQNDCIYFIDTYMGFGGEKSMLVIGKNSS